MNNQAQTSSTEFTSTTFSGRIWKLGNAIDTDLIVPSRVLTEQNLDKIKAATLEPVFPTFSSQVQLGDMILAGTNFGCGSSREEAAFILKELGISCVIATSYARIFYRNAINLGLPPITMPHSLALGNHLDRFFINIEKGILINETQQKSHTFVGFPSFLLEYLQKGGAFAVLNSR